MIMRRFLRRIWYFAHSRRNATLLDEEMKYHRELLVRDLEAGGLSRSEAGSAATRRMGNDVLIREDARGVWMLPTLESAFQDIRYGLRILKREPTFSIAAIATLACGIG